MKQYVIVALIVIAGIVPFASRAVFLDEHIFLKIATNAQLDWKFPQDTPSVFFGTPLPNFAAHTHPPVGEYYLALLYRLFGHFSEVRFRLLFAIFPVAAALAFYFLARRFTEQPLLVALLFVGSPAFFVISPTLMMDMPLLAFLLGGVAFYFAHLEGRPHTLWAAAFCFVLAAGTGYTALVPLACLFISILMARRPRKELLAVALAPVVLAVWQIVMTVHFGGFPLAKTIAYYAGQPRSVRNLTAIFSFMGGVTLFPYSSLIVGNVRKMQVAVAATIATIAACLIPDASLLTRSWYIVLAISGILLLVSFVKGAKNIVATAKNTGESLFILWVPATLLFFIVVADMINARYILLALPALYLVVLRQSTRRQLALVLIPTFVLSACIAYSDFQFVNSYREWVGKTIPPLQKEGFRVWSAAESGLRFYLEQQQGITTLTSTDLRPTGTDLVVTQDLFRYGLAEDLGAMLTVLVRAPLKSSFPIRTFSKTAGAGFHDSGIGPTPFSLSLAPFDFVEVAQVSPFVQGLPQKGIPVEEVPAWSPKGVILKQNVDVREFRMKIPGNSKLEYELVGRGSAEMTPDGIRLRRFGSDAILWQRFRIVPAQFAKQGN